jgi:hypothetical protein
VSSHEPSQIIANKLKGSIGVILKIVTKYLTLVKKSERVRWPSQRSNVLLKIIRLIYLTYMCVACVTHVTHSSNVLDQILVCWLFGHYC